MSVERPGNLMRHEGAKRLFHPVILLPVLTNVPQFLLFIRFDGILNNLWEVGMPQEKVRSEIENGIATQFDPRFAKVMLQMIDEDTEYSMREK